MTKLFTISLLFVFATTSASAQNDQEKIKNAVTGFFNGLSLIDADSLQYYSTTDFHLLEDGEIWNLDTLVNRIMPRKNAGIKRVNEFEFIRLEQKGSMVWVSYHNTAIFSKGDKQRISKWIESAVLQKEKGRWKIQMLHSTPLEKM